MAYLMPSEYAAYGLSADTSDAWIAAASSMMEAYCRRTSLLSTAYTERLRVSRRTGTAQLTYGPVVEVTAAKARYASCGQAHTNELLEFALAFNMPGQWVTLDATTLYIDAASGELRLPHNLFGLGYSELEVSYTAGLPAVPDAVKFACAQIVKNAQATPGLNVKLSKLDTLQTEYFSDSLLDTQVKSLLRPFCSGKAGLTLWRRDLAKASCG